MSTWLENPHQGTDSELVDALRRRRARQEALKRSETPVLDAVREAAKEIPVTPPEARPLTPPMPAKGGTAILDALRNVGGKVPEHAPRDAAYGSMVREIASGITAESSTTEPYAIRSQPIADPMFMPDVRPLSPDKAAYLAEHGGREAPLDVADVMESGGKALVRGFASTAAGGVEGITLAADATARWLHDVPQDLPADLQDDPIESIPGGRWARAVGEWAETKLRADPRVIEAGGMTRFFGEDVMQGLGSFGASIAAGLAGGYWGKIGQTVAATLIGSGADAMSRYREAKRGGAGELEARRAAGLTALATGALEYANLDMIFGRLDKATGGALGQRLAQGLKEAGLSGVQEAATEIAQGIMGEEIVRSTVPGGLSTAEKAVLAYHQSTDDKLKAAVDEIYSTVSGQFREGGSAGVAAFIMHAALAALGRTPSQTLAPKPVDTPPAAEPKLRPGAVIGENVRFDPGGSRPFNPAASVVDDGRGKPPPRTDEELEQSLVGRVIKRWNDLTGQDNPDEAEIRRVVDRIDELWRKRPILNDTDRRMLEAFVDTYRPDRAKGEQDVQEEGQQGRRDEGRQRRRRSRDGDGQRADQDDVQGGPGARPGERRVQDAEGQEGQVESTPAAAEPRPPQPARAGSTPPGPAGPPYPDTIDGIRRALLDVQNQLNDATDQGTRERLEELRGVLRGKLDEAYAREADQGESPEESPQAQQPQDVTAAPQPDAPTQPETESTPTTPRDIIDAGQFRDDDTPETRKMVEEIQAISQKFVDAEDEPANAEALKARQKVLRLRVARARNRPTDDAPREPKAPETPPTAAEQPAETGPRIPEGWKEPIEGTTIGDAKGREWKVTGKTRAGKYRVKDPNGQLRDMTAEELDRIERYRVETTKIRPTRAGVVAERPELEVVDDLPTTKTGPRIPEDTPPRPAQPAQGSATETGETQQEATEEELEHLFNVPPDPPGKIRWSNGERVQYTGETTTMFGGEFYEVEVLEGPDKGKIRHVKEPPEAIEDADPRREAELGPDHVAETSWASDAGGKMVIYSSKTTFAVIEFPEAVAKKLGIARRQQITDANEAFIRRAVKRKAGGLKGYEETLAKLPPDLAIGVDWSLTWRQKPEKPADSVDSGERLILTSEEATELDRWLQADIESAINRAKGRTLPQLLDSIVASAAAIDDAFNHPSVLKKQAEEYRSIVDAYIAIEEAGEIELVTRERIDAVRLMAENARRLEDANDRAGRMVELEVLARLYREAGRRAAQYVMAGGNADQAPVPRPEGALEFDTEAQADEPTADDREPPTGELPAADRPDDRGGDVPDVPGDDAGAGGDDAGGVDAGGGPGGRGPGGNPGDRPAGSGQRAGGGGRAGSRGGGAGTSGGGQRTGSRGGRADAAPEEPGAGTGAEEAEADRPGDGGPDQPGPVDPSIETRPDPKPKPPAKPKTDKPDPRDKAPKDAELYDYHIKPSQSVFLSSPRARIEANIDAIIVARRLMNENRRATPEEKDALALWSGWGPNRVLWRGNPRGVNDPKWNDLWNRLIGLIDEQELIRAEISNPFAFYTSPKIVRSMYAYLQRGGLTKGAILEPAVGNGVFFGAMPLAIKEATNRVAIEADTLSAEMAKRLYERSQVRAEKYQEAALPSSYFDLIISNVPFANRSPYDKRYPQNLRGTLHDYYFVRSIDLVRPGGVVAFITSAGTLNKPSPVVRSYLQQHADFVGAIRLNTASLPGTEVTADVIFLRRRREGDQPGDDTWVNTGILTLQNDYGQNLDRAINQYFLDNPELVLGTTKIGSQYSRGDEERNATATVVEPDPKALTVDEALARLPNDVFRDPAKGQVRIETSVDDLIPPPSDLPPGAYFLTDDLEVRQVRLDREGTDPLPMDDEGRPQKTLKERLTRIINVRQKVVELQRAMLRGDGDEAITNLQKEARNLYKRMVGVDGTFYQPTKRGPSLLAKAVANDSYTYGVLAGLERVKDRKVEMGDIFTERILEPLRRPDQAASSRDALLISLDESASINLDRMAELLKEEPGKIKESILEAGMVFEDPMQNGELVMADAYLSGNVRAKLESAEAAAQIDRKYERNVEALREVIPEDLKPHEIKVNIGAHWLDREDYVRFIEHIFGGHVDPDVSYNPTNGKWSIRNKRFFRNSTRARKYSLMKNNAEKHAIDILEDALNLKSPIVKREVPDTSDGAEDGDTMLIVDDQLTEAAQEKLDAMQEEFQKWVWTDADRMERLVERYNRVFNSEVLRLWDGSHMTFPGMVPEWVKNLHSRPHQVNAIYRIVANDNVLLFHHVGSGKTRVMIAAAMELRRLKKAKKPVIVVKEATFEQFFNSINEMYPNARVLPMRGSNMTPAKRRDTLAKAAFGDWDIVLMTHDVFKRVPLGKQVVENYFNDKLMELRQSLEEANADNDENTVRQLGAQIEAMEERMRKLLDRIAKDTSAINFEDLGIDQIFMDESQAVKKLPYYTQMQKVKGLNDPSGSGIAMDMEMKARWVSDRMGEKNRGIVFASGTPLDNSIGEMYVLKKFLIPHELDRIGVRTFDQWVHLFARRTDATERTTENEYKPQSRLREYVNIPELRRLFFSFADWVSLEDLKKAGVVKVPMWAKNSKGERTYEDVLLPASPALKDAMRRSAELAKYIKENYREAFEAGIYWLNVMHIQDRAAIDLRLEPGARDDLPPDQVYKADLAAERAYNIWKDTKAGSPKLPPEFRPGGKHENVDIGKGLTQAIFLYRLGFKPDDRGFSVAEEIQRLLIERGVPADEIVLFNDKYTEARRLRLFDDMNAGRIRILIGTGAKMSEGVNIQRLLHAAHHIDAPDKPSVMRQANGRLERHGNLNEEIRVFRYAQEASADEIRYGRLMIKQHMFDQFLRGELEDRTFDDFSADALSFAEIQGLSAQNPYVMKLRDAERELGKLRNLQADFERERIEYQETIAARKKSIKNLRAEIKEMQEFVQKHDRGGAHEFKTTDGTILTKPQEIGQYIADLADAEFARLEKQGRDYKGRRTAVGEYNGMTVEVEPFHSISGDLDKYGKGQLKFRIDMAVITPKARMYVHVAASDEEADRSASWRTAWNAVQDSMNFASGRVERIPGEIDRANETIAEAEKGLEQKFERKAELEAAEANVKDLKVKMESYVEDTQATKAAKPNKPGDDDQTGGVSEIPKEAWLDAVDEAEGRGGGASGGGRFPPAPPSKRGPVPGAPGTELTVDQLEYIRKYGSKFPDVPMFGMGGMANLRDPRNAWKKMYDSITERIQNPRSSWGKKFIRRVGRGLYGLQWQMKPDWYQAMERIEGRGERLPTAYAEDLAREFTAHADALEKRFGTPEARKQANYELASALDNDMDPNLLDPPLRKIYENFKRLIDEKTDEWLAMPELHPYAEAFGLANFNEIVQMRREGDKTYLRRVFEREIDEDADAGLKQTLKRPRRRRIREGVFKPRRSDKGTDAEMWTVVAPNGVAKQYDSPDLAIEEFEKQREAVLEDYITKEQMQAYRAGKLMTETLPVGVRDQLDRVKLQEPFGVEQISKYKPIDDVRVRMARTLTDWYTTVEVLKAYAYLADTVARWDKPPTLEGQPNHMKVPDSPKFGPLAGMWVPEPVFYNLMALDEFRTGGMRDWYHLYVYLWKSGKTIFNPVTWSNNIIGLQMNYLFGGIHPVTDLGYFKQATEEFRNRGTWWKELVGENEINVGWSHELFDDFERILEDVALRREGITAAFAKLALQGKRVAGLVGKAYDFPDQVSKLAAYIKYRTQGKMTQKEALYRVRTTFPNYARPGDWANWARNHPAGAWFVMFMEQTAKIYLSQVRDRPGRVVGLLSIPGMITLFTKVMLGMDDEEYAAEVALSRTERGMRMQHIAPFSWLNEYFQPFLPWRDAQGRLQRIDLRYKIPLANDVAIHTGTGGLGLPYVLSTPLSDFVMEWSFNRDNWTGRQLWNEDDPAYSKLIKFLDHSWRQLGVQPRIVEKGFYRMVDAALDSEQSFAKSVLQEVFGIRVRAPFVSRALAFKMAKERLAAKDFEQFKAIMSVYNELYRRPGEDAPIRPSRVVQSLKRDMEEAAKE